MIQIVVAVLAVSPYTIEVGDLVQIAAQAVDLIVSVEVSGISLFDVLDMGVDRLVLAPDHADLHHLGDSHLREVFIGHGPHLIALVAEILETDPDGVLDIRHHVRRPVVEDLEAAHFDTSVMYIYPVVRDDISDCRNTGLVFQLEAGHQDTDSDVIAVGQSGCDLRGLFGDIVHAPHQIFDRHRGDENITGLFESLTVPLPGDSCQDTALALVDLFHTGIHFNTAALLEDLLSRDLPELAGAVFGIAEFLDQRGLDLSSLFSLEMSSLAHRVLEDCHHRHSLDTLGAPLRRHL